jgi:hypothetical protein
VSGLELRGHRLLALVVRPDGERGFDGLTVALDSHDPPERDRALLNAEVEVVFEDGFFAAADVEAVALLSVGSEADTILRDVLRLLTVSVSLEEEEEGGVT